MGFYIVERFIGHYHANFLKIWRSVLQLINLSTENACVSKVHQLGSHIWMLYYLSSYSLETFNRNGHVLGLVKIADGSSSFSADMEESDVRVMIQGMMIDVGLIENPMNTVGEGDTRKGVHTRIPLAILLSTLLNIQGVVAITALIQRVVNVMVITR